jgi:hypothetical protein
VPTFKHTAEVGAATAHDLAYSREGRVSFTFLIRIHHAECSSEDALVPVGVVR